MDDDPDPVRDRAAFLLAQAERRPALRKVMPEPQTLLFEWCEDAMAADGTRLSEWVNVWTRAALFVSDDGRLYSYCFDNIVPVESIDSALQIALPSERDWLGLGGYRPGPRLEDSPFGRVAF